MFIGYNKQNATKHVFDVGMNGYHSRASVASTAEVVCTVVGMIWRQ